MKSDKEVVLAEGRQKAAAEKAATEKAAAEKTKMDLTSSILLRSLASLNVSASKDYQQGNTYRYKSFYRKKKSNVQNSKKFP